MITDTMHIDDKFTKALLKYNTHPSIIKIKESNTNIPIFKFNHTTVEVIDDIIKNIDVNKASSKESIPAKILKINNDIFSPIICNIFNSGLDNNTFPSTLKCAEIKPVFKKDDRCNKENYRPVSLLKVCSKIHEKVLYGQINSHFEPIFSPLQCGFRKGLNIVYWHYWKNGGKPWIIKNPRVCY